ncbi:MAG TPA: hypothetical protein VG637_01360, partial [Actinomycetes bacterium]|nr:hypothetical protein [Actinomycetes bacterium]
MKLRIKLIAGLAAVSAVMLALPTDAGALLRGMPGTTFSGVAAAGLQPQTGSGGTIPVQCQPGSATGRSTSRMQLWLSGNPADGKGTAGDLSNATSVRATWAGGSQTLTRAGHAYTTSSSAKFPCPNPNNPNSRQLQISVQAYRGAFKVGAPARIYLGLYNPAAPGSETTAGTVTGTNG